MTFSAVVYYSLTNAMLWLDIDVMMQLIPLKKMSLHSRLFLACCVFLPAVCGNSPLVCDAEAASVKVTEPRCEYLSNPLGLDVSNPRLSWRLEARNSRARGQRQTAYDILVSSDEQLLEHGKGDLWDSGLVNSDESVNIPYEGKPLQSGMGCFWKVRVRDEHGNLSDWSQRASWTMGLLSPADWKAKWIGADAVYVKGEGWPPPDNTVPDPWFRKAFDLASTPSKAVVYVASIGYHELYVNGQKVGDSVLMPSTADYRHRARYVTYDVQKYLKPGRNVIGLWLGVSWSIFPPYQSEDKPSSPIVMAQAEIKVPKTDGIELVTDETWKTHPSPNRLLGVWNFMHYGGEIYDANLEIPNWCSATLDDAKWKSASIFHPNLTISAEKTEPNRRIKEIKPVAVREITNGTYRVDMGSNFSGWFEMKLSGQPGDRIEFQFSERENESMTHRLHSAYIIGPSGKGTFCNRFNYDVGRWIQISGLRSRPSLNHMRGWLVRTDYQRASGFQCDQPLLNHIYDTTLWTFENLSLGNYVVDCPQRERMGYGGDAHATTRTALNNYTLGAFYTKWAEDWRDVQGPDGNLPYTAPTYWGGGGPVWSGFCVTLPWEMYRRYGDTRILEESLPTIQKWLAFLETKSTNDMLERWGGEWDFLGDWLWPGAKGMNNDSPETLFFNNCYWIYNLQTAARIAHVLRREETAATYERRADTVRAALHPAFFHPDDNSYVNGFPAYLAMALLVNLPPRELRTAVWQRLEKEILVNHQGHVFAGITGGAFLFKFLLESDRNDLIYAMAGKEDYPGWEDMLAHGATTFYEDWEGKDSCLHSSYLYIGSWFIEGLGGIRHPDAGGFKHFDIDPWIDDGPSGPGSVRAHYDSLYGRIATSWTRDDSGFHLSVTVPPNTYARLHLHNVNPESLSEGGQNLSRARGAKMISSTQDSTLLELEPGRYEFDAHWLRMH
jgi:alpha-L-rhamnosidase